MNAATLTAHGVLVSVDGLGVWLRGASGAGKSELGLELVSRGHRLVADDAIEFHLVDGCPHGRCPPLLDGFIEIRGLGILNLRRLYGDAAIADGVALDLIIDLGSSREITAEERLHGRRAQASVLGVEVAQVSLAHRVGHNLAVLVETACRDHRLRRSGYDACGDLIERQSRRLAVSATGAR